MDGSNALPHGSYAGLAADDLGQSDERPPLVLLHGLTFDRTMWRPALAELEAIDPGRRAVAFDLPGHGESPKAASYSMLSVVERVHAAIVDAHLDAPVVVGHSGSAGIASVYAAMHPTTRRDQRGRDDGRRRIRPDGAVARARPSWSRLR